MGSVVLWELALSSLFFLFLSHHLPLRRAASTWFFLLMSPCLSVQVRNSFTWIPTLRSLQWSPMTVAVCLMKASTASTLPAEWTLLSLTPPSQWCVPTLCFQSPKGAVLWSLCSIVIPLPRELAKAVVVGWVFYRHAVLSASAAVGFGNGGKEAPQEGSTLVQRSSPWMAIKCHSSWGSIFLSIWVWALIPAFDEQIQIRSWIRIMVQCGLFSVEPAMPYTDLCFHMGCFCPVFFLK